MTLKPSNVLLVDHNHDGVDRRGFLKCMAWAGTGALCVFQGGVLKSFSLSDASNRKVQGELSFVQISDSHMGFNKPANPDVIFTLHTGDITHLSKPAEFDQVQQLLQSARAKEVFFVPGEHDVLEDDGQQYRERFGKNTKGAGWYSFDKKGVHFVGLVNVMNLKAGGMG